MNLRPLSNQSGVILFYVLELTRYFIPKQLNKTQDPRAHRLRLLKYMHETNWWLKDPTNTLNKFHSVKQRKIIDFLHF